MKYENYYMDEYAKQALEEYNSEDKTVRQGGKDGKLYWNINSSQFIYAPKFLFPEIPGADRYIYTVTDSNKNIFTFTDATPWAQLTPIWKDIAVGIAELKVEAVVEKLNATYLTGARTFYKSAPFPGRGALPERACSYKECAQKALDYVFNDEVTRYWLEHGKPDPEYYHNVYPSKMISSIVYAMIAYAELEPKNAKDALKIATNATDYLISITYDENSKMYGVPPTYSFKGLNKEIVDKTAPAADGRKDTVMMIYPATVGSMYLRLEKVTGNSKYFEAAKKIAEYYKNNVLENGSWYLLINEKTGINESFNCCVSFSILEFLNNYYKRTGEECWHKLETDYFAYLKKLSLENYNWEGQFEDIGLSGNYRNLTHIEADKIICYVTENFVNDEKNMSDAIELIRYVEDQFVVWGDFAPWNPHYHPGKMVWYSPAGLEQYFWYVPIDASTSMIMRAFISLYKATDNKLYLEKACALGDSITRMQDTESGVIPTHWMKEDCAENLENFWINCHIGTTFGMMELAKTVGEIH